MKKFRPSISLHECTDYCSDDWQQYALSEQGHSKKEKSRKDCEKDAKDKELDPHFEESKLTKSFAGFSFSSNSSSASNSKHIQSISHKLHNHASILHSKWQNAKQTIASNQRLKGYGEKMRKVVKRESATPSSPTDTSEVKHKPFSFNWKPQFSFPKFWGDSENRDSSEAGDTHITRKEQATDVQPKKPVQNVCFQSTVQHQEPKKDDTKKEGFNIAAPPPPPSFDPNEQFNPDIFPSPPQYEECLNTSAFDLPQSKEASNSSSFSFMQHAKNFAFKHPLPSFHFSKIRQSNNATPSSNTLSTQQTSEQNSSFPRPAKLRRVLPETSSESVKNEAFTLSSYNPFNRTSSSGRFGERFGLRKKSKTARKVCASLKSLKSSRKTNTGIWTKDEHAAFLSAFKRYGRQWSKIAALVPSRSRRQIMSHAQKVLRKEEYKRRKEKDNDAMEMEE